MLKNNLDGNSAGTICAVNSFAGSNRSGGNLGDSNRSGSNHRGNSVVGNNTAASNLVYNIASNNLAVIFDCDGTLLDSMEVWHALDDRLAALAGIKLAKEDRDFMTSATLTESSVYLHDKLGVGSSVDAVYGMIRDDMLSYYQNDARPKPGAMEFVQELHELGIPMGVASSTPPFLLNTGLQATGFADYLSPILSVEDVGSSKRERHIFDAVRKQLGAPIENTWVVEDALYAVNSAKRAGYSTLAVFDSTIAGSPSSLREAANMFIMSLADITAQQFVTHAVTHACGGFDDEREREQG